MNQFSRLFTIVLLLTVALASCKKEYCGCSGDLDLYRKWEITAFVSVESMAYAKLDNYNPVIEFKEDGTYSLKLDRNNCFGAFTLPVGNEMVIAGPGCTKICCDSDFSNKAAVMLSQVENYELDQEERVLRLSVPEWGFLKLELP